MTHLEVTSCVETKGVVLITSNLSEARHWKIWEVLKHEFGCTTRYPPLLPPVFCHQGWIALGFRLQTGCTPFGITLTQSSMLLKLTCTQIHYICTNNTQPLTTLRQPCPIVATLLLRRCGREPSLTGENKEVEFQKFAHCCRGLPVAIGGANTPLDALSAPMSPRASGALVESAHLPSR